MGGVGGERLLQFIGGFAIMTSGNAVDTLRRSTAAYVRFVHDRWPKNLGRLPDDLAMIGQKAPPIVAKYWSPAEAADAPRPTPGHVALVTFLAYGDCLEGSRMGMILTGEQAAPARCFQLAATLHRLARQFPSLQITTVARTHGYFAYLSPSPDEEAALIERELSAFDFPGAIAVAATPFTRLAAPDDRRIDAPDSNVVRYAFGAADSPAENPLGAFYLIDADGTLVSVGATGQEVAHIARLIDVLVHRGSRRAAESRP
jgi:hypothetical protein